MLLLESGHFYVLLNIRNCVMNIHEYIMVIYVYIRIAHLLDAV